MLDGPLKFFKPPANPFCLKDHEVHVWYAQMKLDQLFRHLLTEDEQRRADRFVFEHHRQYFIFARAMLRRILGHYLQRNPAEIHFLYGEHGKPSLASDDAQALQFNLSHSHDVVLCAVTLRGDVGVDIEAVRSDVDSVGIAKRFFTSDEYQLLESLPEAQRKTAFFNAWVRKEAFLKAIGAGLTYSLNQVEVTLLPGEPATLLKVAGASERAKSWALYELDVGSDYAAALVVPADTVEVKAWDFGLFS